MSATTGRVIAGRYNLVDPIGRGAMGVVWRARDSLLDRDVAIKEVFLSKTIGEDERENAYRRTMREARTAARLSHRGVVTVYDVAEDDGRPWIIMELVPSKSLEQLLTSSGPLPPRRACRVGQQLLAALAAAHGAGVLHRDVKPSNVLIANESEADGERAVLTDFGIAQFATDPRLTQTGMVMGSPGFTAPERIRGGKATPASDLWSLGATLFAAVEGHGPYEKRGGAITTMSAIIDEDPPLASTGGPLAPLIGMLMNRDPTTRPTAAAAAGMFAGVMPLLPELPPPPRTPTVVSALPPAGAPSPHAPLPRTPTAPGDSSSAAADAPSEDARAGDARPGDARPGEAPAGAAPVGGTAEDPAEPSGDIAGTSEDPAAGDADADDAPSGTPVPEGGAHNDGADNHSADHDSASNDSADAEGAVGNDGPGDHGDGSSGTRGASNDEADNHSAGHDGAVGYDRAGGHDGVAGHDGAGGYDGGAGDGEPARVAAAAGDDTHRDGAGDDGVHRDGAGRQPAGAELTRGALAAFLPSPGAGLLPAAGKDGTAETIRLLKDQGPATRSPAALGPAAANLGSPGPPGALGSLGPPGALGSRGAIGAVGAFGMRGTPDAPASTDPPTKPEPPIGPAPMPESWAQPRSRAQSEPWAAPPQQWGQQAQPWAAPSDPWSAPAPQTRRRRGQWVMIVGIAVVLAAVIGAAVVLLPRFSPAATTGTGHANGTTTSGDTGGDPNSPVNAINTPLTALPAGWTRTKVPASQKGTPGGFSIGVPPGWTVRQKRLATIISAPKGGRVMEIDMTPHDRADEVQEVVYIERNGIEQGLLPGYDRIGIQQANVRGNAAAYWQYTWVPSGQPPDRVGDLVFETPTTTTPQSFAVDFSAPVAGFQGSLPLFNRMMQTFRPLEG